MKTSATQFETMVNFMKQHGDINKPEKTANGRIQNIENWTNLTNLLNSDPTGEQKTTEKWKKVWSDLKNNTKKKVAKINRAAHGGPALLSKLTELEQCVLNISGAQANTGLLQVVKVEFDQEQEDSDRTLGLSPSPSLSSYRRESLPASGKEEECSVINNIAQSKWHIPGPSQVYSDTVKEDESPEKMPVLAEQNVNRTPPLSGTYMPAHQGHIFRSRRGLVPHRGITSSSRRFITRPRSNLDKVVEHLLNSEREWKKFLQQKHEDETNLEKERLRIRELELRTQQKWIDIATRALTVVNKVIETKLCNECD